MKLPGEIVSKWHLSLAKAIVTLVLLAIVILLVDFRQVGAVLRSVRWPDMLTAAAAYQVGILARAWRWQALLRAQDMQTGYGKLVSLSYVGIFFNAFLPSGFGGDVVKSYELSRQTSSTANAVSTVLADRVMGLAVLLAMALTVLPLSYQNLPGAVIATFMALTVGFFATLVLFLNRPLMEWLARHSGPLRKVLSNEKALAFYNSFSRYSHGALLRSAAASLLFNITLIVTHVYLARAAAVFIPVTCFFVFVPILSSLLALPISVGGFGVREGGYMLLFGQVGVTYDRSVAISLLFYALSVFTGLLGASLYLWQSAKELRLLKAPRISKPAK